MNRPRQRLADFLADLKKRSGHSYEMLARKSNLSRSSVHRYCTGDIVPTEFGIVERIARACGANHADLSLLYRLWANAVTDRPGAESPPAATAVDLAADPTPAPARRQVGHKWVALVAVLLVIACALALTGSTPAPTAAPPRPTAAPWTQAPTPVPRALFGVTLNSSTGAMPAFQVDAVRLWDSRTRWSNIQPRRGEYDWSILDRLVDGADKAGLPVLFTMGGTPGWASPNGPRTAYDDGSRTSPPDELADWRAFVHAVATRYRGRIDAYELWVMGNDPRYYSGDLSTLVSMTRTATEVIDSIDPDATTVCPSMGRLWEHDGRAALEKFAALRGYDTCDAAGVKLHHRSASDPPEQMLELVAEIDQALHRGGAHPPLWSTGTTYEIPLQTPLAAEAAADHAARFFLVGLYARYQRMYFYNWGGAKIPIVLQTEGQPPTRAALHVEELRRWLHGAMAHSCGTGHTVGLPADTWRCTISRDGAESVVLWTSNGTARVKVPRGMSTLHRLDGTTDDLATDGYVRVTTSPVLLSGRGSPPG
ncbi:helix-turn-helix domain-containing protein [Actinokineospora sp.]|uniref:helix-turn-helix domain-containing protein n=1 Tax=Actinokineospora sp. TaxID=1872133 RepID=UPI003D6B2FC8